MVLVTIETPKQCLGCEYLKRIPLDVCLEHYWPIRNKASAYTVEEARIASKGWLPTGYVYGGQLVCIKNTYCKHLKFVKKIKKLEKEENNHAVKRK